MALEDFVDPEVGIAVAATALVASPQVRNVVRRGLVYGLAGVFKLGDAVSAGARSMTTSAQQVVASTGEMVGEVTNEAQPVAEEPKGGRSTKETTGNE